MEKVKLTPLSVLRGKTNELVEEFKSDMKVQTINDKIDEESPKPFICYIPFVCLPSLLTKR